MVLVDTSVWVAFLRGHESDVQQMKELIKDRNRVVLCGPVLQEVLQGIGQVRQRKKVLERLSKLPYLETTKPHYVQAGELYASLRRSGVTVASVDVLIAVHAIHEAVPLLSHDKHFEMIATHSNLRLYR